MMGLPRAGGLKVGSNLPISQLGVLKCLARGRRGDRIGLPEIIVKQGILLQLDIHTSSKFQEIQRPKPGSKLMQSNLH